jgi:hypothetical protein
MDIGESQQINLCPCGSGNEFSTCCQPYASLLNKVDGFNETLLISWINTYSVPIQQTFWERAACLVFRISIYADFVFDAFYPLGFKAFPGQQEEIDGAIRAVKHNIMLSLFASLSCLAQGLFLQ